jgi:hypothetical protein
MQQNKCHRSIRQVILGFWFWFLLLGVSLAGGASNGNAADCDMPFAANSPWNTPLPKTATHGSAAVAARLPIGLDTWDPKLNWVIPYYKATEIDPKVQILYNPAAWLAVYKGKWRRSGNPPTIEAEILASSTINFPYPGNVFSSTSASNWSMPVSYNKQPNAELKAAEFHVPTSSFLPAAGGDGHLVICQPSGAVLEAYGTIILSNGTLVALSYSVTDPSGPGDGWQRGQTASMLPSYGGAILDSEINSGIRHAMSITVPPGLLSPKYVYPAYAFDRDAVTNGVPYSGDIPMGARLAIPSQLRIDQLGLATKVGAAIATAAQNYGFIIVDRGGEGITIRVRPTQTPSEPSLHSYDPRLDGDLRKIFAALRVF